MAEMSLTEFLLARIAEDEAVLRDRGWCEEPPYTLARVLAECEAKRQIVNDYLGMDANPIPAVASSAVGSYFAVKYLAAVYSDHPDYRQEWKP